MNVLVQGRGRIALMAIFLASVSGVAQSLPQAPSALRGFAMGAGQQAATPQQGTIPPDLASPEPVTPNTHPPSAATQAINALPQDIAAQPVLLPCEKVNPRAKHPSADTNYVMLHPEQGAPCKPENPLQSILSTDRVYYLTPTQKGELAIHNVIDPFNILTIVGYSGISIAANSHTAYGPGFKGFGKLAGYSMVEDMQGEFFGTYLIPVLAHEDPRYHRLPGRPLPRRILHAFAHTIISQHDDGTPMPNYATILTYPISAELGNLYVPGIGVNGPSTAKRILAGYATDPAGALVAEFLPDIAKHIHIRVVFVQQILQRVATQNNPNAI